MKKNKLKTMGLAIAALIVTGSCSSNKNALQTNALDGEWNIMTVNGEKAEAENTPYIGMNLQKKQLYGYAGCNRIMGVLQVDSQKAGYLSFGQVGSTRMLCANMDTEQAVLEALNQVAKYKGTEKELTLTDEKGHPLLTLSKRPAHTLASLNGKWNIAEVNGQAVEDIEQIEKETFLEFDVANKTIHGCAGCNIVNGSILQEEDKTASLKFDKLITTMMAGPGMTIESKVLEAMNKVNSFMVKDEKTAVLLDENGKEIITLIK